MKNLLILFLLALSLSTFSQNLKGIVPKTLYTIADTTKAIGQPLSEGSVVISTQDNKIWRVTKYAKDTTKFRYVQKAIVSDFDTTYLYAILNGKLDTLNAANYIQATGGQNVMGQNLEIDKKLIILKGEFGGTSSISEALFSYGDAGSYINFSTSSGRILRSKNGALTVKSTDVNKDVTLGVSTEINNYENYLQHAYDTISIRKSQDIGLNIINKSDTTAFSVKSNGNLKISSPLFLDSIPSATTPNTLYYNTTTKEVSYGAAPVTDTTNIIYSTGGNNVMEQPLVVDSLTGTPVTGTNQNGYSKIIKTGNSTGNGTNAIELWTTKAGASGTGVNTPLKRVSILGNSSILLYDSNGANGVTLLNNVNDAFGTGSAGSQFEINSPKGISLHANALNSTGSAFKVKYSAQDRINFFVTGISGAPRTQHIIYDYNGGAFSQYGISQLSEYSWWRGYNAKQQAWGFGTGAGTVYMDLTDTLFTLKTKVKFDSLQQSNTAYNVYYNTSTKRVSYDTSANGFFFVQDSAVTITPAVQDTFYHVTNATNNLFTQGDTLYTNIQNDTIFFTVAGKYKIEFDVSMQGTASKDYSFRLKNHVPCNGIRTVTGNGANNYVSTTGRTVCTMAVGDFIVLQFANRSGTEDIIIREASIYVKKI